MMATIDSPPITKCQVRQKQGCNMEPQQGCNKKPRGWKQRG